MNFFLCGSGFRSNFFVVHFKGNLLHMDSKTDLTTNGLILEVFVGICLISSPSYLQGLKSARNAQKVVLF